MLEKKGVEFEEVDGAVDFARRDQLWKISGSTELPQVFINPEYMGGYR
jgi:glutaredoxin